MLLHLRTKESGLQFVVANTHLFWDPMRADIKSVQTHACLRALSAFILEIDASIEPSSQGTTATASSTDSKISTSTAFDRVSAAAADTADAAADTVDTGTADGMAGMTGAIPVVMCGDFNTMPEMDWAEAMAGLSSDNGDKSIDNEMGEITGCAPPTAPFELLQSGRLSSDHPEHPDKWYQGMAVRQAARLAAQDASDGYDELQSATGPRLKNQRSGRGLTRSSRPSSDSAASTSKVPRRWREATPAEFTSPRLGTFESQFRFRNAYLIPEFKSQRPLFSTKTDDFRGWIDHVWVSEGVDVQLVYKPPVRAGSLTAITDARAFEPIPSQLFPSDHIPVGAVVRIAPPKGL